MELQIIYFAFHRNDPAIQQIIGTKFLSTKIIDEKHTIDRRHMERRVIESHIRTVLQIEHLQSELATGNSDRPYARQPALVGA